MACCKNECACLSIIIGIVAGVILGILYTLGFVSTGIVFWAYIAIGIVGAFISPIYAMNECARESRQCFCGCQKFLLVSIIGTIIVSSIGLIVAAPASTVVVAIVLGVATLFTAMLISGVIFLANCLCNN